MTIQQAIETTLSGWEEWNELGVAGRSARLRVFSGRVTGAAGKIASWQLDQAAELIAETLAMPGPTGEANDLSTAGRGCYAIMAEGEQSLTALSGQLTAALVAGNTVLLCGTETQREMLHSLHTHLLESGIDPRVVQLVITQDDDQLCQSEQLAGIAFAGTTAQATSLNRKLSARKGALAQLVAETDLTTLPVIGGRHYLLRFITERTRTNNTTAVGGNATLLELGGKAE